MKDIFMKYIFVFIFDMLLIYIILCVVGEISTTKRLYHRAGKNVTKFWFDLLYVLFQTQNSDIRNLIKQIKY